MKYTESWIYHHGIKGQKWGQRNGPPYPLGASDHSASEKKAGWRSSLKSNSDKNDSPKQKKSIFSRFRKNKNSSTVSEEDTINELSEDKKELYKSIVNKYGDPFDVSAIGKYYGFEKYRDDFEKMSSELKSVNKERQKIYDEFVKADYNDKNVKKIVDEAIDHFYPVKDDDTAELNELTKMDIAENGIKELSYIDGIGWMTTRAVDNYSEYKYPGKVDKYREVHSKYNDYVEKVGKRSVSESKNSILKIRTDLINASTRAHVKKDNSYPGRQLEYDSEDKMASMIANVYIPDYFKFDPYGK